MTISIWRYSHFLLALVSSLFLLIASITGVILAVEPIQHQAQGYAIEDLEKVSLATAINNLEQNYDEVFHIEVESSGFVKASVLTTELETLDVYVDPRTGEQLGKVPERPYVYRFATNLHRSLFLKSIGRFFIGLISFLLFLITVTGLILITKRQGGLKRLFSKVQKDYFELRYHVVLSRWFFVPIIVLSLTGVYLSAEKFNLLPDDSVMDWVKTNTIPTAKYNSLGEIPFFQNTTLEHVRKIEFPFSDDPGEYYQIALKDKEIRVDQETGGIIGSASYPLVTLASRLSMALHTGEGSVVWSIILLLASASILFFIYSGFVMALRRIKRAKKTAALAAMPNKDACEIIILVGSETGTTYDFGTRLFHALNVVNKKVLLTELNHYSTFARAEHVIVLTSTYGEGEAPTNARKFHELLASLRQPNDITYAVVGFGSMEYPDYCKYAIQVDGQLQKLENWTPLLPLHKINNADFRAFQDWAILWSEHSKIKLSLQPESKRQTRRKPSTFKVIERTELNADNTFLLKLKPKKKEKFTSGDLLSIIPNGSDVARQYSIAKMDGDIVLSIKKHKTGRCSTYLSELNNGDIITAWIDENPHFHFPEKTTSAVLIANGTGIAPFLGMLNENRNSKIRLYWGVRYQSSSKIYDHYLEDHTKNDENINLYISHSREGNKKYVQESILDQREIILKTMEEDGVIMICGSLSMQHQVLDSLESMVKDCSDLNLELLEEKGQLKMDCY